MDHPAVVGSTNSHLIIDRLSAGAEALLGLSGRDLIGQSLLELVSPADVANLVKAAARSIDSETWTSLPVSVHWRSEQPMSCRLLLVAMRPEPSLMFALTSNSTGAQLVPGQGDDTGRESLAKLFGPPTRPQQPASPADAPGLTRLSAREMEIVTRLFNGDRVPAIAGGLFLSQSTVRNHLSAVFRKLGVRSQQELIHQLRDTLASPERASPGRRTT